MGSSSRRRVAFVVAVTMACTGLARPEEQAPRPAEARVEATVPMPPTAFNGDGKTHLGYELRLTNHHPTELKIERVEAVIGEKVVFGYGPDEIRGATYRPGLSIRDSLPEQLDAGGTAVVFMWVELGGGVEPPEQLHHRVLLSRPDPEAEAGSDARQELVVETFPVAVKRDATVLSPPLRGDGWLAANGPGNSSGHRRALIPVNGRPAIAQRFAIDWVQLFEEGRTWKDDRLDNANYRCYGTEVLSVADGVVTSSKDGIPENVPGPASRAVEITMETIAGNYVIVDIGDGLFAFYAHMQPGSVRVKPGDRVQRGDVLGLVGNSGNSTEPHLHFHLGDADSPLGAEGLPYLFESFELWGSGRGWKPEPGQRGQIRRMEMPMQNQVIRFIH